MLAVRVKKFVFIHSALALLAVNALAAMSDYVAVPPFVSRGVDANVLLDLSIETPMQGAAYNDQADGGYCAGRYTDSVITGGKQVGTCYFANVEYVGIFDPGKCYDYTNDRFEPAGTTNENNECSGNWHGNFLNWATMTAIDELRWAMTGGNRVVDTTSDTVIQRAKMDLPQDHSWYPVKMIDSTMNVSPATVTPYSDYRIFIYNHGYQFDVGTTRGGHEKVANLNVRVKVCDPLRGLEDNCVSYGSYYKPEGLIQRNAIKMRFAVMSYALDNSHARDGGVLRSNMKYVGPKLPDGSDNPAREYGSNGIFIGNPEGASEGASGVINYLNKFGANGYKTYDPVSELFYECLNFYKNRGPTLEYYTGLTEDQKDGFPVITNWEDPIQHWCQKNYIIGINDANPWNDKSLPGTYFNTANVFGVALGDVNSGFDYGQPSNSDPAINVRVLTNTVGDMERLNGTTQCVGYTALDNDGKATLKTITALGEVMGTCPSPSKENSYYVAGLAYYANAYDIRDDAASDFANGLDLAEETRQSITTFMIDTQEYNENPLVGPMNMLWLAGKYGGFEETDFNNTNDDDTDYEPNLAEEWDKDGDGLPDNYILASNPQKLIAGLNKAFTEIIKRTSSATAVSVISNSRTGEGAVYQSIFLPSYDDMLCGNPMVNNVTWIGEVRALFVDAYGNMREDTNSDRTLNLAQDRIIIFGEDKVYRVSDTNGNGKLDAGVDFTDTNGNGRPELNELEGAAGVEIITQREIKFLWSSSTWLNSMNLDPIYQRAFMSEDHKRHILTFIDGDNDMVADTGELIDFDTTRKSDISPYLHLFTPFEYTAENPPPGINADDFNAFIDKQTDRVINYVRGQDQDIESVGSSSVIPAMRSRKIDYSCDDNIETWRLGDIVHSTPTLVGRPAENYDLIYGDGTYSAFYRRYIHRRQVIYVGSNDGMLHAFNGGFYDLNTNKFWKDYDGENFNDNEGLNLGAELWAYIPYNLLPHLFWLTDPEYQHIYYVDLKPKVFDARIFNDDEIHPNGWGTVLVAGMRLGGGIIGTDKDHDGQSESDDLQMFSAYAVFDITDPESPPNLLAEINFSRLGYTTSYPAIFFMNSKWYLVLGSGPISSTGPDSTALQQVSSSQNAKIYIIDLNLLGQSQTIADPRGNSPRDGEFYELRDPNSFISDPVAVDFNLDYKTNALYFGTVSGSASSWGGQLRRILIKDDPNPENWIGDSVLLNTNQPITAAPSVAIDRDGQIWIYFGTGRFANRNDSNDLTQQSFYGIKEDVSGYRLVHRNDLLDVSTAAVFNTGKVTGLEGDDIDTFNGLVTSDSLENGWLMDFPHPGERNVGQAAVLGDLVSFTTYVPNNDLCLYEGASYLYALYSLTGTSFPGGVFETGPDGIEEVEMIRAISLGQGLAITPNIHVGRTEGSKAFIQISSGGIPTFQLFNPGITKTGRAGWREE